MSIVSGADFYNKEIFLKKAANYYQQNKLDRAINLYLQVLKNDPYDPDALTNIGAALIKKGLFSEAYPYIKKLVTKFPNRPENWINLAICEIGLGKLDMALKYLDKAEKKMDCPEFVILLHKGIIFSKMGKIDEALRFYKKAEFLDPNNPTLIFNIALLYEKKRDYKNALLYYQTYMKRYAKSLPPDEKGRVEEKIYLLSTRSR